MLSRLREAISGLADLLLPLHCVGCDVAGTAWCPRCAGRLGGMRRVDRPLFGNSPPVFALGRYRGVARRAVLAYKEDGQRALAAMEPVIVTASDRAIASTLDDLGSATFRADLASLRHETQYTRLFRS